MKVRLDKLLVDRGLVETRTRAQAMVIAGRVLVNEQKIEKPGTAVAEDAALRLLGEQMRYVSRGGLKLEAALRHWQIALDGVFCLDVGASTGGFTDCMLQHGAARVLAIDTGYGQIAEPLRRNERVELRERTNARLIAPDELPRGIGFVTMDVSFISATLVLPPVIAAAFGEETGTGAPCLDSEAWVGLRQAIILVKPQFEAGRGSVGKGGIVRDPAMHQFAIERVRACVLQLGASKTDVIDSPITGMEGNKEFLLRAQF